MYLHRVTTLEAAHTNFNAHVYIVEEAGVIAEEEFDTVCGCSTDLSRLYTVLTQRA